MQNKFFSFCLVFVFLLFRSLPASAEVNIPAYFQQRIDELIEQLGHQDWQLREKATDELILIGSWAKPDVEKALKHSDPEVRERARQIMPVLKWQSAFNKRINEFTSSLRQGSFKDQQLLYQGIEFLKGKETIYLMVDFIKESTKVPQLRKKLCYALANAYKVGLNPILPDLLKLYEQEQDNNLKPILLRALGHAGPDERINQILRDALASQNNSLRVNAIQTITQKKNQELLPDLLKLLQSGNDNTQRTIIYNIYIFKQDEVRDKLLKLLSETDKDWMKSELIRVLADYYKAKRLLPVMLKMLDTEKNNQVRNRIFATLPRYKGEQSITPTLLKLLKDSTPQNRSQLLNFLKQMKNPAVVPELIELLESEKDFMTFNSILGTVQAIAGGQKFTPTEIPPELKQGIIQRCQEWVEKTALKKDTPK